MKIKKMSSSILYQTLFTLFCALFVLSSALTTAAQAHEDKEYVLWKKLTSRAVKEAEVAMDVKSRRHVSIVLTSAGYSVIANHTTEACLDTLQTMTRASIGNGTLLNIRRSRLTPLWFFFYDKTSGNATYVEVNGDEIANLFTHIDFLSEKHILKIISTMPSAKLFKEIAVENIEYEYVLAHRDEWNLKFNNQVFNGNGFSIVAIANAIAYGAPYDLLQAIRFHDHYCPGVTSGYFIANYLDKYFPLENPGDRYFYFSVPPWCKDDAIQVLMNTTPGEQNYAVTYLNAQDRENLKDEFKNLAGIMFRLDSVNQVWNARVVGFDFDALRDTLRVPSTGLYDWESRLIMDIRVLSYLDQTDTFVQTLKEFSLTSGENPADYDRPGINIMTEFDL